MAAPVNEGNIIVGAGQLYKLWVGGVTSCTALTNTIILDAAPVPPAFVATDRFIMFGTSADANNAVFAATAYNAGTRTIDVASITADSTGGTIVAFAKGRTALGGTEDGAEFTAAKEFHDVQAAEAPVTLRKELVQMTPVASVGLLENTLDNLILSWWGEEDPTGTLTIGTDGDTEEMALSLVGKAPSGSSTRTYIFWRVVSIGDGGHRYTKGANTVITCEFECLPVWNDATGKKRWDFGRFVDA